VADAKWCPTAVPPLGAARTSTHCYSATTAMTGGCTMRGGRAPASTNRNLLDWPAYSSRWRRPASLAEPLPRENRFGSPLELSRVHWVRPEVVVEVTYLTWTEAGLLRAVSYQGQREDKHEKQVVRPVSAPGGIGGRWA